jgi:restriction system protein
MIVADTARMSGKEFELYVRDQLMRLEGYANVEMTRESGDMGADLVVRHNGKIIVIQCKRYAGAVGLQAVQEVLGAKHFYEADEAWVITDSTFTEAARKLAKAANVRLRTLRTKR